MELQNIIDQLKNGAVGVLPTDTLYGLVASAFNTSAVERIYQLKERNPEKAVIILLSEKADLKMFGISPNQFQTKFLEEHTPGPVSFIISCKKSEFTHLHRGLESLAFRIPDNESLRALLAETGPLVAPSANREGEQPASTIAQAKMYFGDAVDFYVEGGELVSEPSTLVSLLGDEPEVLRQGAVKVI